MTNVTLPGTGSAVSTETIAGIEYENVFSGWGPAGTFNKPDVATGKPFPVQIRSATGLIPGGEPTDAANTSTDGTSVTWTSILKQISKSIQALVTAFNAMFAVNGLLTNRSGTAASTASNAMSVNPSRRYLFLYNPISATHQNISVAESLFYSLTETAVINGANSTELIPGASFEMSGNFVSAQALSVICTTSSHRYVAKEG